MEIGLWIILGHSTCRDMDAGSLLGVSPEVVNYCGSVRCKGSTR